MPMKLLVTGANGQLGRELRYLLDDDSRFEVIYTDVAELDITRQADVDACVSSHRLDYIVNCAAYTAVDRAEDDEPAAMRLNAHAVEVLATAAARHGVRMVHVSTDYVFDGESCVPYNEEDAPHQLSAYGRTKWAGERALLSILPQPSIIFRTAWLYSPHGKNFVKTMLDLGKTCDVLKVVYDQVGNPTSAIDLARAIVTAITYPTWHPGIYHFGNEGAVSWYDFTKAILRLAGIITCNVQPCRSDEYPAKAHRPKYSVFDKSKYKTTFQATVPYWIDSLTSCLERLNELK